MTPRQLRARLRTELLSHLRGETLRDRLEQLEQMAFAADQEPPAGAWAGNSKDTLMLLDGGTVVAALTIQMMPTLDPFILRPGTPWPALVLEIARLRAEGILAAQGHDEYRFAVPEDAEDLWHRYISESEGSEEMPLRTYRRPL